MIKVITYGTYDLFHYGHQRLLECAKELVSEYEWRLNVYAESGN